MHGFISGPAVLFHLSMSVFVLLPYCFDYCSLVVWFKIRNLIPPALLFFLKIVLVIQDLLCFHTNFRIASSVKNAIGLLIGIALNL